MNCTGGKPKIAGRQRLFLKTPQAYEMSLYMKNKINKKKYESICYKYF